MQHPNWLGVSKTHVLLAAADYLKQPVNNLNITRQLDW